jgi:hypothetical protein
MAYRVKPSAGERIEHLKALCFELIPNPFVVLHQRYRSRGTGEKRERPDAVNVAVAA